EEVNFGAKTANRASEGVIARLVSTIWSLFFGSSCRAMGTHDRTIHRPLLPINRTVCVKLGLKQLENALPSAIATPGRKAIIDGLPSAIAFWDIRPGRAGM